MNELTKEYFDETIHDLKKDIQTEVGKTVHEIRKDLKTEIKDLRTEVGVLFENVDDKLGLIIESQNGIRDDIKTIKNDRRRLDERVSKTEIRLDVIEAR